MMINKIKENIWQIYFKNFGSCVYLINLNNKIILIDTSSKQCTTELQTDLKKLKISPNQIKTIILTHNHYDHVENLNLFQNAQIYFAKNINTLPIKELKIFHTPGHTQEDICILYQDVLFSGDIIFHNGYVGRTDLPESNSKEMQKSLEKLKKIKYKILCPGHLV